MIGLIGAMEDEISLLKGKMINSKTKVIAGIEFRHGALNGRPLVLCKAGVGKVQAACAAVLMASAFGAQSLIFTGVAGGTHPDLKLGDIVVATDCLYHDMDATAMGWKPTEIPDGSPSVFPCDPRIAGIFLQVASSLYGSQSVYKGRIVSGDIFVADSARSANLHRILGASAVDMESAAVAHIALKFHLPCCIIRSISDKSGDGASIDYSQFLAEAAAKSAELVSLCISKI